MTVGRDRRGTVAGAVWLGAEVFKTEEASARRGSRGGWEQHGPRKRVPMNLEKLKVRDTCHHLERGKILTTTIYISTLNSN